MGEVTYDIISKNDLKVVIRKFSGIVDTRDVLNSFKYIQNEMLEEKVIGIVTDFDESVMNINLSQLQEVIKYLKSTPEFHQVKLAVVVNTPGKIVIPMMAQAKTEETIIKPFSTVKAAINWIFN